MIHVIIVDEMMGSSMNEGSQDIAISHKPNCFLQLNWLAIPLERNEDLHLNALHLNLVRKSTLNSKEPIEDYLNSQVVESEYPSHQRSPS